MNVRKKKYEPEKSHKCLLINVINLMRIIDDQWCDYETTQVWNVWNVWIDTSYSSSFRIKHDEFLARILFPNCINVWMNCRQNHFSTKKKNDLHSSSTQSFDLLLSLNIATIIDDRMPLRACLCSAHFVRINPNKSPFFSRKSFYERCCGSL